MSLEQEKWRVTAIQSSEMTTASRRFRIGVKEFNCIGVSPPHDHPHIYLEGNDDRILCPYCATLFRIDPRLGPGLSD